MKNLELKFIKRLLLVLVVSTSCFAQLPKPGGSTTGGGGGGGGSTAVTYIPTRTSATILTLPATAATDYRIGNSFCAAITSGATFTVSSGTGTLWLEIGTDCLLHVRHNIVGTCSAGCTADSGMSGFSGGSGTIPLHEWIITASALAAAGSNRLTTFGGFSPVAGTNITFSTSAGVTTISSTAGSSYPPLAADTSVYIAEEFVAGRCNTGDYIGEIGWLVNSNAGGESLACTGSLDASHPGVATITTGTVSGNDVALKTVAIGITPASTFTIRGLIKLSASTTVAAAFGLCDGNFYNCGTNGVYFEKLAADTNWFAGARNATTATRTDTGVAAGTGWIAFQIQRTSASNIAFKTATTLGGLVGATAINITTNVPTAVVRPYMWANTEAVSTRSLAVDFIDLYITGLVR